jgi:hypothetical protein
MKTPHFPPILQPGIEFNHFGSIANGSPLSLALAGEKSMNYVRAYVSDVRLRNWWSAWVSWNCISISQFHSIPWVTQKWHFPCACQTFKRWRATLFEWLFICFTEFLNGERFSVLLSNLPFNHHSLRREPVWTIHSCRLNIVRILRNLEKRSAPECHRAVHNPVTIR